MKQYLLKNGQTMTVREANEDDAEAIKNVVNSVASEKYYVVPERSREDWDEAIREIKNRKGLIIVTQLDEKTVGMAHLVRGKFEKNKHVGFLGISILKEFRKIGIGTAMMKYIMEWARRQKGLEKVSLTVFSTNEAAINLYRTFGFPIEGMSKKQYKIEGKYIDETIMGKFLD
ncbi:MAG: GNAT family N-acetyltransferase [Candidatus Bathyarchaeota archaeon]|nr:GNAT family N-acetyltransferase [Candidatus Bathyarchaeota archaeon]